MDFNNLLFSTEDGICTITINRPDKLNALNIETIQELGKAFRHAAEDDSINGIILTGAGEKAFVAGADIAEFASFNEEEAKAMSENGHTVFDFIESLGKPVVAAVNGFALGGGCELAMACHMRVAAANARFGQPEVNLGVTPGYGGTQRLVRLIGRSKATELLLTADMMNAADAERYGLVNYVTEPAELLAKAKEILLKIATKSPYAVMQTINAINAYYDKDLDGFQEEIMVFAQCFDTEDFKEGVAAFLEKRKPKFERKSNSVRLV